jgi:hypothetical protein
MKPIMTPWGAAQTVRIIAPGITEVTTASHGGIYLSPMRYATMPDEYRKTFAGGRWYEEDCDAAKVVVTFPEHFTPAAVMNARRSIEYWNPETQT